jgi:hypothetical protein
MSKRVRARTGWNQIDPYVSWALGPGRRAYFEEGRAMPLLLRLNGDLAEDFLDGAFLMGARRRARWRESFWVLGRRVSGESDGVSRVWACALAPMDIVEAMASKSARQAIESVSLGPPLRAKSLRTLKKIASRRGRRPKGRRVAKSVGPAGSPPAVVMGIIDDGLAFANERFLIDVGGVRETRVQYCLLQATGTVLTKSVIDPLLVACDGDEELFYRQAGLFDYVVPSLHQSATWRTAHGTHVMDLACGYDPQDQVDDRPIVCVHLPTAVTAAEIPGTTTTPGTLYFHIANAIQFIIDRALDIAADYGVSVLPVVINLSYGLLADPHDGSGGLEAFIEDKIAECLAVHGGDLRVVLPTGNSYLARTHAQASFTGVGQKKQIRWRVQPDDRTPSYLEVWLPAPLPLMSRIALTITSPTGATVTTSEGAPTAHLVGPGGYYLWADWAPWAPSARARFVIIVQATANPEPSAPLPQLAPAGTWTVTLEHTGGFAPADLVQIWIRRDDQIYGFPLRGRQSYLNHADYERFDHAGRDLEVDNTSLVQRQSTINSMATGRSSIVIGGYLGKERVATKYSSAGPNIGPLLPAPPPPETRGPPRWPDAVATSDDSRVHRGVLAAGSRTGSVVAMGGTSVAAPQIARLVAADLAGSGLGDHAAVQGWAEVGMPPSPLKPPDYRGGAGRIATLSIVKVKRFD